MQIFEFPYGRDIPLADGPFVTLFDSSSVHQSVALESAVRGARVLTDAGIATTETITIHRVDTSTQVYTWVTALTPIIGEVLIGVSNTTALTNMASAISGSGTPGTDYATGTEPCLDYDVASDATTLTLTAVNSGTYANTAIGNFAETGASASWAAATTGVVTPDFSTAIDYGTVVSSAVFAPFARNGVYPICPSAALLTAKRTHCELDDNSASVFERIDFLMLTTDHPLAGKPNGALYAGILDDPADLADNGTTVEIPNSAHADFVDWVGNTTVSVPDVDDIVAGNWMTLFNPYSGDRALAEIKAYDFTDAGFGTDQGQITFVTGGAMRIPGTLRNASVLWYLIRESNVGAVNIKSVRNDEVTAGTGTPADPWQS